MVNAYKVSRDLCIVKLDELFCKFELHEQAIFLRDKGLAIVIEKK